MYPVKTVSVLYLSLFLMLIFTVIQFSLLFFSDQSLGSPALSSCLGRLRFGRHETSSSSGRAEKGGGINKHNISIIVDE